MRTPPRALAGTAAGLLSAALVLTASSGGNAAPAAPAQAEAQAKVQGDNHDDHVIDNRKGRLAPTSGQSVTVGFATAASVPPRRVRRLAGTRWARRPR